MGKGRDAALVESVEQRIATEVGAALQNGGHVSTRTLACARALAPRSQAVRHVLAESARVLIKGAGGFIGAVGVTGDTSDNDEAAALAGIAAAGLTADPS